jgi:CheY-like chemotaxis protein
MSRVLLVEDSPTQAQQIVFQLEDVGFEAEVAGSGADALAALSRGLPDIVLTDLEMPGLNGLQLVEQVCHVYPGLPIVLMTAYGSEEIAALALRKGATSYVPKRYLAQDLVPTLGNILAVTQADRQHQRILEFLVQSESRFILPNDDALIPPLIGHLEGLLSRLRLYDQTALIRVCVALREALVNAMHHGNLEVRSAFRETDHKAYFDLIEARRHQEPFQSRRVYVTAIVTPRQAEFIVRDEGPGYDPTPLPDPHDLANLERVGGRGLWLIHTFMDQVTLNESGNEITMIKCRE